MPINLPALECNLHRLMWTGREYTAPELYRLSGASNYWGLEYFRVKMRAYRSLYPCIDGIYSIKEPVKLSDGRQKMKHWSNIIEAGVAKAQTVGLFIKLVAVLAVIAGFFWLFWLISAQ